MKRQMIPLSDSSRPAPSRLSFIDFLPLIDLTRQTEKPWLIKHESNHYSDWFALALTCKHTARGGLFHYDERNWNFVDSLWKKHSSTSHWRSTLLVNSHLLTFIHAVQASETIEPNDILLQVSRSPSGSNGIKPVTSFNDDYTWCISSIWT